MYAIRSYYATPATPSSSTLRAGELQWRFDEVVAAIKLVFACVFEREAREHVTFSGYKLEEEKMAVVLQEIVGAEHGGYFYPDVSVITSYSIHYTKLYDSSFFRLFNR